MVLKAKVSLAVLENYILILLGVIVALLVGVIFYGWKKVTSMEVELNQNKYDVEALRNLLNKMFDEGKSRNNEPIQMEEPTKLLESSDIPTILHILALSSLGFVG